MRVVVIDQQPVTPTFHRHGDVQLRGGQSYFFTRCGRWWAQWVADRVVIHTEALNIDRRLAQKFGKPCRRCFP